MRIIRPIFGLRVSAMAEQLFLLAIVLLLAVFLPHTPDTLVAVGTAGAAIMGGILDAQDVLSDAQAFSGVATTVSTNAYDSGAAGNDISVGEPLAVCFAIDVAAKLSAGDETYRFELIQSAAAALSSPDVLIATNVSFLTKAVLVLGYKFYLPIPPGLKSKRYLGWQLVAGGTAPTITVSADIRPLAMVQNDKLYTGGFLVSS